MALLGDTFYVGNTDGVVAFPYRRRPPAKATAAGPQARGLQARRPLDPQHPAQPGRHEALCRRRLAQQHRRPGHGGRGGPGRHLGAGSRQWRRRIFAGGLRNPVGLAWEPTTGALWTVVNERDGLGDETPPDYLTSVAGRRLLRLALLLLGPDGRRPRAAGRGAGRQRHPARLRARRAHRVPRPVLAARRHAAGLRRRHGDRPARLLEPQHGSAATR